MISPPGKNGSMKNMRPSIHQGQSIKSRYDNPIARTLSDSVTTSLVGGINLKDVEQKVWDVLEGDDFKVRDQCGVVLLCLSPEVVVAAIGLVYLA